MRDLFEQFGQQKVQDIRTALENNKINASGRLSNSVLSEVKETANFVKLTVTALAYIGTVDIGRKATVNNNRGEFTVEDIKDWIAAKRISTPEGMTTDAFASAIYTKINKEGTEQFRSPPRTIIADAIELGIKDFESKVAEMGIEYVLTELAKWQRL